MSVTKTHPSKHRPLVRALRRQVEGGWEGRIVACTYTSVCWVDGIIGLGALSIHELAPNEELVGHLESQLLHCLFHLGRKLGYGGSHTGLVMADLPHIGFCDRHMPRDAQRDAQRDVKRDA